MDRSTVKQAGRKKHIREKQTSLKEKQVHRLSKAVMRQAGRYRAIDTAKKQLNEARQTIAPEQEQQPYTAVDKVETFAASTAYEAHSSVTRKPTPQQLMRREAVKDFKKRHTMQKENAFHGETDFPPADDLPNLFDVEVRHAHRQQRRIERSNYETPYAEVHPSAQHSTGQRRPALSRFSSSDSTKKAALAKEQGRRYARDRAIKEITSGTARTSTKAGTGFMQKLGAAVSRAVVPEKETLLYAAGALILIIIPFVVIIGVASMLMGNGEGRSTYVPVSAEVEAYTPIIQLYANQYGIPEYTELIKAIMMQESGGQGTDPMQCSESGFNTRFPHAPGAITDPEYSIDVGVQTIADVIHAAGAESPIDLEHISLALQGYNFGSGYISWALANYGGDSELNAIEFSDMMAARFGWSSYGDKTYVSHVLRYYPIGRSFMSEGNTSIVAVAQTQIGNEAGYPQWSGLRLDYCMDR